MCRHLAYLGPPIALADLLFEAPHALVRQAWAPRQMRGGGTINADGFGVGWYPDGATDPVRYRRDCPMWSDANLPALAGAVRSGAIMAAVRSATLGLPVVETASAPFTAGRWLFSHNGTVAGWPDSVARLAGRLPVRDLLTPDAPTDSALLWALVLRRLRGGAPLDHALADTVVEVAAAAPGSRLNLLLTDGVTVAATASGHTLSVLSSADQVLISSEPVDHRPGWQPVPERHIVVATASTMDTPSKVDVSLLPTEVGAP